MVETGRGPDGERIERRASGSRLKDWLLLDADRHVVTAGLLTAMFLALVAVGHVDPTPLPNAITDSDPIETTFQALLTAVVTGVTLVVTINQLVISQELGAAADQRERMEGSRRFRGAVEDVLDRSVSPAEPAAFLSSLVAAVRELATELDAAAESDEVEAFVADIVQEADYVERRLDGAEFGTYAVVGAVLEFDYSTSIYRLRQLRVDLDGEADAVASELLHALELFGPAREHFKTLYFQWELVDLSRAMLYAAVPALLVAAGSILYVADPGTLPGTTLGVANVVWYVSAAVTVVLSPFFLLLVYVIRIATVTKRTLAMGPFVLRSRDDESGN